MVELSSLQSLAITLLVGSFVLCCVTAGIVIGRLRAQAASGVQASGGFWKWTSTKMLGALLLALCAGILATVLGWTQIAGEPYVVVEPTPTPTPIPTPPPEASFDDLGSSLSRCSMVNGRAHAHEGKVLVVGEHEVGEDQISYEKALISRGRFSSQVEIGDAERKKSYELILLWMDEWEYNQLVDATRAEADAEDLTYFGLTEMPTTGVAVDSAKVSRTDDAACR